MQNEDAAPPKAGAVDHRAGPRRRSLKGGRIIYGNLSLSMDCMVRSMSSSGARLEFAGGGVAPDEFYLFITADHLIARVAIAWRSATAVGVRFLEPLVHPRQHPDPRIQHLRLL